MESPSKSRAAQLSKRKKEFRIRLLDARRYIAMALMLVGNLALTGCGGGSSDQSNKHIIAEGSLVAKQSSLNKDIISAAAAVREAMQEGARTDSRESSLNLPTKDNPGTLNITIDQTYQEEQKNSLIRLTISETESPILNF
jgi:hypothetical protein